MTEENKITEEEQMQITMGLIINAGNAKAFAVEAITCAKNGDFEGAKAKLKNADRGPCRSTQYPNWDADARSARQSCECYAFDRSFSGSFDECDYFP